MKRSSRTVARKVFACSSSSAHVAASSEKMSTLVSSSPHVQDQRQKMIMLHPNRHMPPKLAAARNKPSSLSDDSEMKTAIITPPPTPQLLLEGDELHISSDGKSHTYYRLLSSSNRNKEDSLLLEEVYDIENARKDITLLQQTTADNYDDDEAKCQEVIVSFPLQEINHGIQNGAGTGSITWDSSIVMGLYFGLQPEMLYGNDVVELGSGVGLGGILTYYASSTNNKNKGNEGVVDSMSSLTLTEINQDVIDMLRYNTAAASEATTTVAARHHPRHQQLHIEEMDWFDFLGNNGQKNRDKEKKYDTIICSDCIYLPSQVRPLSETIVKLLRREKGQGDHHHHPQLKQKQEQQQATAHIFSPYNRGCIQDLIHELQEEKKMDVNIETLELSKFRVKSSSCSSDDGDLAMSRLNGWLMGNDDKMVSSNPKRTSNSLGTTSKFVHITVTLPPSVAVNETTNNHLMLDID
jgi:predicted nicotinamide N-methyase